MVVARQPRVRTVGFVEDERPGRRGEPSDTETDRRAVAARSIGVRDVDGDGLLCRNRTRRPDQELVIAEREVGSGAVHADGLDVHLAGIEHKTVAPTVDQRRDRDVGVDDLRGRVVLDADVVGLHVELVRAELREQ